MSIHHADLLRHAFFCRLKAPRELLSLFSVEPIESVLVVAQLSERGERSRRRPCFHGSGSIRGDEHGGVLVGAECPPTMFLVLLREPQCPWRVVAANPMIRIDHAERQSRFVREIA